MTSVSLSSREQQLLELASRGHTDHAIAHQLSISVPTVATYWGRIRIKMGPLSRPELVAHHILKESQVRMDALRAENEALRQQLGAIPKSMGSLQSNPHSILELVKKAPDAVLFIAESGQILAGNEAAGKMFGCATNDFPTYTVNHFIPDDIQATHREHRRLFFESGTRAKMGDHSGVTARRLDGSPVRIEATVSVAQTEQGNIAIVFAREIDMSVVWPEVI